MKNLIVSYSYTGNNGLLTKTLSDLLKSDVFIVKEKRKRTKITMFLDQLFERRPKIEAYPGNLDAYELVIFVAPLWFDTFAFPLRSFMTQHKENIKNYAFISLCGYKGNKKFKSDLEKYTGRKARAVAELPITKLLPEGQLEAPGYQVKEEEMEKFSDSIKAFVASLKIS